MRRQPETRNPAGQGGASSQANINADDSTGCGPNLQELRLISRFGFAVETAVTISQLAWGISR
jgi:hypothetical protein